jgi:hypothetical protein
MVSKHLLDAAFCLKIKFSDTINSNLTITEIYCEGILNRYEYFN